MNNSEKNTDMNTNYDLLARQAEALLSGQRHRIANAANLSALIYQELPEVNWVGFYFLEGETLVLGPFQGRPACVQIDLGKGVCGTAAAGSETLRIANVHEFDGHIVCDADSESELVVPLFHDRQLIGVLDLDSPRLDRFSEKDQVGIERLARIFETSSD